MILPSVTSEKRQGGISRSWARQNVQRRKHERSPKSARIRLCCAAYWRAAIPTQLTATAHRQEMPIKQIILGMVIFCATCALLYGYLNYILEDEEDEDA